MGGFGSGRYGGRSTVEGPRCKVQAGSGGAADASAFGAGQDPRDGAPRPHLGAGPSLVVTGKAPRSLAGRSQVRSGLAPGGERIRTSGPTFKEDSVPPSSPFVFWCPAAIVLTSENTDFELPASRSNLARRTT